MGKVDNGRNHQKEVMEIWKGVRTETNQFITDNKSQNNFAFFGQFLFVK